MTSPKAPLPHPLLVPRMVWGALIFSSFMYSTILTTRPAPETPSLDLLLPLGLTAAMVFVMSFILPVVMAKSAARAAGSGSGSGSGAGSGAGTDPGTLDLRAAAKIYFVPFILRMALGDAVCIMGLAIGFNAGVNYYYPFWAAGLVAMLAAFPTESSVRKLVRGAR